MEALVTNNSKRQSKIKPKSRHGRIHLTALQVKSNLQGLVEMELG